MSTVLEALDTGTAYQVRIRAVSANGNGTWSRVESETTYMSELFGELENNELNFPFSHRHCSSKIAFVLQSNCGMFCSHNRHL